MGCPLGFHDEYIVFSRIHVLFKRQADEVFQHESAPMSCSRLQEENEGLKDQLADLDGDADRVERKKDS